eukprot:g83164.t1
MSVDEEHPSFSQKRKKRHSLGAVLKSPAGERRKTMLFLGENDDEAEKEMRRQKRKSHAPPPEAKGAADSKGQEKKVVVNKEQMGLVYEECIKLATAGKINSKNTWQLKLIDYMQDMVRSENSENSEADLPALTSTNFTRASCTLDASVQIYSSRVDAVHKDTFKVLGGLSNTDNLPESDTEQAEGASTEVLKKKKKKKLLGSTLEQNVESLNVQIDTNVPPDPLFQKMSASFDEGGAHGLLLNSLLVYNGCKLPFDSAEACQEDPDDCPDLDSEDEEEEEEEPDQEPEAVNAENAPSLKLNMEELKQNNDLSELSAMLREICGSEPAALELCPGLERFAKKKEAILSGADAAEADAAEAKEDAGLAEDLAQAIAVEEANYQREQDLRQAEHKLAADNADDNADDGDHGGGAEWDEWGEDNAEQLPVRPQAFSTVSTQLEEQPSAALGYLEDALEPMLKHWAGTTNWALMRRKKTGADKLKRGAKREKKEMEQLNFLDLTAVPEEAFAPPTRAKNTLTEATLNKQSAESDSKNLLPEDYQYKPRHLQTLFLKKAVVCMRKLATTAQESTSAQNAAAISPEVVIIQQDRPDTAAAVVGEAQLEFEQGLGQEMHQGEETNMEAGGGDDDWSDYEDNEQSTQPAAALQPEAEKAENKAAWQRRKTMSGLELLDAPGMVAKVDIGFAKVSKKVDVRALKKTLWDGIATNAHKAPKAAPSPKQAQPAPVSFQQSISSLEAMNNKDLSQVSVAYCFICLLHLANEEELFLQPRWSEDTVQQNLPKEDLATRPELNSARALQPPPQSLQEIGDFDVFVKN